MSSNQRATPQARQGELTSAAPPGLDVVGFAYLGFGRFAPSPQATGSRRSAAHTVSPARISRQPKTLGGRFRDEVTRTRLSPHSRRACFNRRSAVWYFCHALPNPVYNTRTAQECGIVPLPELVVLSSGFCVPDIESLSRTPKSRIVWGGAVGRSARSESAKAVAVCPCCQTRMPARRRRRRVRFAAPRPPARTHRDRNR